MFLSHAGSKGANAEKSLSLRLILRDARGQPEKESVPAAADALTAVRKPTSASASSACVLIRLSAGSGGVFCPSDGGDAVPADPITTVDCGEESGTGAGGCKTSGRPALVC